MTDMIEKIARAMAEVEDYYQQTDDAEDVWRTYIPHAKAALTALEQPSQEVIDAMASAVWSVDTDEEYRARDPDGWVNWRDEAEAAHAAMIKAARGDQ